MNVAWQTVRQNRASVSSTAAQKVVCPRADRHRGAYLMGVEIERKFRVRGTDWQRLATGRSRIRQAYLVSEDGLSLRVRLKNDDYATLTIKSRESQLRRLEFEYPIPTADAEGLMALRRGSVIEKVRRMTPEEVASLKKNAPAAGSDKK